MWRRPNLYLPFLHSKAIHLPVNILLFCLSLYNCRDNIDLQYMKIECLHLTELIHELTGCSKSTHMVSHTHIAHIQKLQQWGLTWLQKNSTHSLDMTNWTDVEATWTEWQDASSKHWNSGSQGVSSQTSKPWLSIRTWQIWWSSKIVSYVRRARNSTQDAEYHNGVPLMVEGLCMVLLSQTLMAHY